MMIRNSQIKPKFNNILKYIFDRVVALGGILCLSPLLVFIWTIIKYVDKPKKVLFLQKRIGRYGKPFMIVKFKTMFENDGNSISISGDPRITQLGKILRKYKVDELPELWNILIGEMSFVGPRPDVPGYADKLKGEARKILELRPGLTGPASMKYSDEEKLFNCRIDAQSYNDNVIFPDKVRINLDYYHNHTLLGDMQIIINTIFRRYHLYA
jgi:lipopolysaccharide/colanic/teichoic acid biosynthesis glycosyltransferase